MRDTALFFLCVTECVFVVSPKYVSFSGNQMLQVLSELMDVIIPSLNVELRQENLVLGLKDT